MEYYYHVYHYKWRILSSLRPILHFRKLPFSKILSIIVKNSYMNGSLLNSLCLFIWTINQILRCYSLKDLTQYSTKAFPKLNKESLKLYQKLVKLFVDYS
jgi:hypothetical protein